MESLVEQDEGSLVNDNYSDEETENATVTATETDNENVNRLRRRGVEKSDGENTVSKKKKKKKKKKKQVKNNMNISESEMESDIDGDGTKKRRKKKKKSKKKKKTSKGEQKDGESSMSGVESGKSGRDGPKIEKRKVRRLGKKLDPEEWTREELMERVSRLGTFELDRTNGSAKLTVEHRRILDDEMKILFELFRRNTEIQTLIFRKCFLTDDILEELMTKGFSGLRHVRVLNFTSNGLTRRTTQLIISTYQNALRPLESIDLRENLITDVDSRQLFAAFSATLTFLNGINLSSFKDHKDNKEFSCSDLKAHLIETGVICCVLHSHLSLDSLDMSRNMIDSNCLILISEALRPLTNIHRIRMNFNPLTASIGGSGGEVENNALDLRGITEFMKMLRYNQFIVDVEMIGGKVPSHIQENIERSLMVNRSFEGILKGNRFNLYLTDEFHSRDTAKKKTTKSLWRPSLTLDPYFLASKHSPVTEINANLAGDKIILPKGLGGNSREKRNYDG